MLQNFAASKTPCPPCLRDELIFGGKSSSTFLPAIFADCAVSFTVSPNFPRTYSHPSD